MRDPRVPQRHVPCGPLSKSLALARLQISCCTASCCTSVIDLYDIWGRVCLLIA